MFHFKQFSIDQAGCAMKVNTDGVLLGAMAAADEPKTILDIGTGTGVIALMLAQRYTDAQIDAVEIDPVAAETAQLNFHNSPFADRLTIYPLSLERFFEQYAKKTYDLIVANPPFYIQSLKSAEEKINQAKHTDELFFTNLVNDVAGHLTEKGIFCSILPVPTAGLVMSLAAEAGLFLVETINIYSFAHSGPHRQIISFRRHIRANVNKELIIYDKPNQYTAAYQILLKNFLIIF